jgi:2'-hydroxyisoflavone reductase
MSFSAPGRRITQVNILIIGGTRFQGRYLVNELLDAGHAVTVFHRGNHVIDPRNGLTDIIGDRNHPADLACLADCEYDVCIDTCAYFPSQIELVADILKTQHYCLISSVYIYADQDAVLREDAPRIRTPGGPGSGLTPNNYGALKALCEEEALARFGNTLLILRPSIIIGMGDHTERLLFWLRLAATYGKRLDIASREPVVQLVDVRDLAHFTVRCVEAQRQGAVNVCGEPVGLSTLLDSIEAITGRQLARTSVHAQDLPKLDLTRLPYCEGGHLARHDTALSRTWGFTGRNLRDSLADIHADCQHHGFAMQNFRAEEAAVLRLFA